MVSDAASTPEMPPLVVGIVTVSDRASAGAYRDESGPAVAAVLDRWIASPWRAETRIVPDDRATLEGVLVQLADWSRLPLVFTTGGTGPAPRDVTPEATMSVCDRLLPGFGEAMRAESLRTVPTAILSRQTAGTRGGTLIVNLPGRPAAAEVCLRAIWPALRPCLKLLGHGLILENAADAPTGRTA
jgi:molybdopterin adenylyltransferase